MSRAEKMAEEFKGEPKGLPLHVQAAIKDVEKTVASLAERVQLAEDLFAADPTHELALEPGVHEQSTAAYRFEEVDGEIIEIRKESARSKTRVIYRPDLTAPDKVDPASRIQALLQPEAPAVEE